MSKEDNMVDEKEANRVFYAVKGSLIPFEYSQEDVDKMYESYTKRLWGNHEAFNCDEAFELAWANRDIKDYPDFVEGNFV
jgi:hypothetical protein